MIINDLLSSSSAISAGLTFTLPPTVVVITSSLHDSDFIDASVNTDAIDTAKTVGPFFLFGKTDLLTFDAFRFHAVGYFAGSSSEFFK